VAEGKAEPLLEVVSLQPQGKVVDKVVDKVVLAL
jgi:hypothetical protein